MADTPSWSATPLDWDSGFWERRVCRIDAAPTPPGAATVDLRQALSGQDFAQLLVDADRIDLVMRAEAEGFAVVDIRCTVVAEVGEQAPGDDGPVRPMRAADAHAVEDLAAASHLNTRFGNDPRLARDRVAAMYRRWVRRDAAAEGWEVHVAVRGDRVVGYVTHGPSHCNVGTIGLIAVHPDARGAGLGAQLLQAAIERQYAAGRRRVEVVTQGGSRPALAMYQAAGFTIDRLGLWLHWHAATS